MPERAAREQALQQFGDLARATATCADIGKRRARRVRWRERVESVAQDVGYAVKSMRRWPGFTLAAVSTIALGIGSAFSPSCSPRSGVWRGLLRDGGPHP
jgi:hypothetical protein